MTFTEIIAEARRFVKQSSTSYTTADITTSSNRALERITSLIREAQGRWQWDDSNNTDYSIATTALTSGTQDYQLDPTHYKIERVEVMDEDGNWNKMMPIDQVDVYDQAFTSFLGTDGNPVYYDLNNGSIFLYPTPNYSQNASLKVFYERGPSYFTTSDTTKEPGFNKLFHSLIPLWSAYDFAFINQLPIESSLIQRIKLMEDDLVTFYTLKTPDDRVRLAARRGKFN